MELPVPLILMALVMVAAGRALHGNGSGEKPTAAITPVAGPSPASASPLINATNMHTEANIIQGTADVIGERELDTVGRHCESLTSTFLTHAPPCSWWSGSHN